MASEIVDYERSPSFWFYFGLIIASDVSQHPELSAKVNPIDNDRIVDLLNIFARGVRYYEKMEKIRQSSMR